MNLWESVIDDCNACLKITPDSMKAHFLLSQAQLALHDYEQAVNHALIAYEKCVETADKSLSALSAQVLRAKKERWDDADKRRRRETSELEVEVLDMMERERHETLRDSPDLDDGERREIESEWERKMGQMRSVFERARSADEQRRKVPEWAIDDISFGFMHDPVIVSRIFLFLRETDGGLTCLADKDGQVV